MLANHPLIKYFALFNIVMIETTMAFINVIGEAIIVETNRELEHVIK
jgi:hypothetical protein